MNRGSARRRVLLGRETLIGLVVVVLAAAICVALGFWQYGRFEDRRDQAAVVETNYEAAPVPLEQVLPEPDAALASDADWTPVQMRGSYCAEPDCVLYVRNRQLSGHVGFWQLVPFRADDGTSLLVVRGWVESHSEESSPADPPPVPEGERTITVRLRPAEPVLDREMPPGQVHSVNPPQIAGVLPDDGTSLVRTAYGELVSESPSAPRPESLPSPDTSLGSHLSYAVQWWVFALLFPAALIYRTRRALQDLEADEADGTDEAAYSKRDRTRDHRARLRQRTRRRGHDEEEEDALIDQQEQ
ncbi:SURF1 family protein [Brachybacterium sp. GCM10030252]|uniref:SURF1 family cytochrome oxidase biogenesis protein n=1 Tax=Brachybacterium sp. GCM10030252 TaxID=3273380 RepID=UPI0036150497